MRFDHNPGGPRRPRVLLALSGAVAIVLGCSSSSPAPSPDDDEGTCINSEGSGEAAELQNLLTNDAVVAGGENPISTEEFESYVPPLPWIVNSSVRSVLFVDSCIFRSPSAPSDCGQDCAVYQEVSGYTWLDLAHVACEACSPENGTCPSTTPPDPGSVTVRRIRKCQTMTFVNELYLATDVYGNEYAMHATPDGAQPSLSAVLPDGWTLGVEAIDAPFVIEPRGDDCSYTLLRDNLDQGYHQITFDAEDALNAILDECQDVY